MRKEFTESITVADLTKSLGDFPQGYKVCVQGCNGIGVYDITQIEEDDRGFIEIYTFNSNEHSETPKISLPETWEMMGIK